MSHYCPTCYRPIPDPSAALCRSDHRPPASNWPALPATLYGWRLTEVVGIGAFGTVYAAEPAAGQPKGLEKVVKVAAVLPGQNLELLRRVYNREAAAHVELRDDLAEYRKKFGTAPIVDGYRDLNDADEWPAAVMNRVKEPTLDARLREGVLPEALVVQIGISACTSLQVLARRKMVHCDIKPANIFVSKGGDVQLADLGSWEREGETMGHAGPLTDITLPDKLNGQLTAEYASPEQLRRQAMTHRSDVYALAVLLWDCVCGQLPFPVPDALKSLPILKRIEKLAPLRETLPARPMGMSEEFYRLLLTALAVKPEARPTAEEFKKKLKDLAQHASRKVQHLSGKLDSLAEQAAKQQGENQRRVEELREKLLSNPDAAVFREVEVGLGQLAALLNPARPVVQKQGFQILPWFALGLLIASGFWAALWGLSSAPVRPQEPPPEKVEIPESQVSPSENSALRTIEIKAGEIPKDPLFGTSAGFLDHDVLVSTTEFPLTLYQQLTGETPTVTGQACATGDGLPVDCVNAWQAMRAANLLSLQENLPAAYTFTWNNKSVDLKTDWTYIEQGGYKNLSVRLSPWAPGWRLPLPLEWEAAARGGEDTVFSGTSSLAELGKFANLPGAATACKALQFPPILKALSQLNPNILACSSDPFEGLAPIGKLLANQKGFVDMTGNVAEWIWRDVFQRSSIAGGQEPTGELRGGRYNDDLAPDRLRISEVQTVPLNYSWPGTGFRLVRNR